MRHASWHEDGNHVARSHANVDESGGQASGRRGEVGVVDRSTIGVGQRYSRRMLLRGVVDEICHRVVVIGECLRTALGVAGGRLVVSAEKLDLIDDDLGRRTDGAQDAGKACE